MLSGLFGKKSDHPLADVKSAQALLDGLPKNDAYKSLEELTGWMESVADDGGFRPDLLFAVLCLLDEAAQPHARKLARDYFSPVEPGKFHENRLWLALDGFHHRSADAYFSLFDRYCDGGKGAMRDHVPLIAARALQALLGRLKYASVHYAPVDAGVWSGLARIYRHAERQDYLDVSLSPYPGLGGNVSVRQAAGHLLGWYGSESGALRPLDIHLAERIVAQFSASIEVGTQPDANSLFGFDLEQPSAPLRLQPGVEGPSSMRFVGMAAMQPKLRDLLRTLDKNVVPHELNLGGSYEAETVRGAVQFLLDYLSAPPSRRSVRRGIAGGMGVAAGFAGIVGCLAGEGCGTGQVAHWEIEDISIGGFRARLPPQGTDGIHVGTLVGVRPEGVPHWGVAVVRRLMQDDGTRMHAGAEMLSNRVFGVALGRSGNGGGFEDGQPALWLQAGKDGPPGEVRLLMKADTFSMHRSLETRLNGNRYLLMPLGLQESGPDYDLARFRAIEQSEEPVMH